MLLVIVRSSNPRLLDDQGRHSDDVWQLIGDAVLAWDRALPNLG
jgi:hypothetical protein